MAILVAFVADLRAVAPVALGVLVWWMWRHHIQRAEAAIGIVALALATAAFQWGNEVTAWALTLAVAVAAGVIATRPTARGRPAGAR